MMSNLFSPFNPLSIWNLNWIESILFTLFMPYKFWIINSPSSNPINLLINYMTKELKTITINTKNNLNIIIFVSLFLMIFNSNFLSLYPFIFSSSSHLNFSLSISLSIYFNILLYSWIMNFNKSCSHLVPLNSPAPLIPFMICIEIVSNIIRPITLAIRLSANIIAGHMLIGLSCNTMHQSSLIALSLLLIPQLALTFLEINVSIIQSYVFSVLSALYSKESSYA